MKLIRSLLFNAILFPYSVLCMFIGQLVMLHPSKAPVLRFVEFWCRSIITLARWILRINFKVEGLENLVQPCLIASKHQSTWETLIFHVLLRDPSIVMKSELASTPMTRAFIRRLQHIAVSRKEGSRALIKMIRLAQRAVQDGRTVVIFPEGARVAPGERVPYQKGVAGLYKSLRVPVVPLALNSGLFWGRRAFIKTPGTITLRFLPAIQPGLEPEVFLEQLSRTLDAATQELCEHP